jgi:hypothetical protein
MGWCGHAVPDDPARMDEQGGMTETKRPVARRALGSRLSALGRLELLARSAASFQQPNIEETHARISSCRCRTCRLGMRRRQRRGRGHAATSVSVDGGDHTVSGTIHRSRRDSRLLGSTARRFRGQPDADGQLDDVGCGESIVVRNDRFVGHRDRRRGRHVEHSRQRGRCSVGPSAGNCYRRWRTTDIGQRDGNGIECLRPVVGHDRGGRPGNLELRSDA